jgi:tricorn protease
MNRWLLLRPVFGLILSAGVINLLISGFASAAVGTLHPRTAGTHRAEGNVDLPRFPSISPDGETVVFSWRGDLWKVAFGGGTAIRLTSHPGRDHDSAWTPDGSTIVFESDRTGTTNLWAMAADGTGLRKITDLDSSVALGGVGVDSDGKVVVGFTGYLEGDLYRSPRPYEVSIEGGEPRRLHDAFGGLNVRSPDGTRAAFERGNAKWERRHYRGDDRRNVWMYDGAADTFSPLTDWAGNDGKPRWSGDDAVLFLSDRANSTQNIHRQSLDGGDAEAITDFEDIDVAGFDATSDGRKIVLHRWDSLFTLDLDDPNAVPRPMVITAPEDALDAEENLDISRRVTEAALNPDGESIAVIAYGEVVIRGTADDAPTRRVTETHGREGDLAWSPDGTTLYFTTMDGGHASIMAATVARTREEIKNDYADRTGSGEGDEGSEEEAEEDASSEDAKDLDPADADDEEGASQVADVSEGKDADDSVEEEGAKDAPETEDETEAEDEADPLLDPARWADAVSFQVSPLIETGTNDHRPSPSPDGMKLGFIRGLGDLMMFDLATGEETLLRAGWDRGIEFEWSLDSSWIVFDQADMNFNQDVFIVPSDGSAAPINISRHPDNDGGARFSADAKVLAFSSERDSEEYDVWYVFLDRNLEKLATPELEKYFEDAEKAAKKRKPLDPNKVRKALAKAAAAAVADGEAAAGQDEPVNVADADADAEDAAEEADVPPFTTKDLETAYLRLRKLTSLPGNENRLTMLPAGNAVLFGSRTSAPGVSGLYSVKWDGTGRKRLGDSVSMMGLSEDGGRLVAVGGGAAKTIDVGSGKATAYPIRMRVRLDLEQQSSEKFLEAAGIIGEVFYDPEMKGLDWPALTERYHQLARKARTADEFNWVANRLIGELSASHMGIRAQAEAMPLSQSIGRLGVDLERVERGYRITGIIEDSPAVETEMPLEVGDVITAIDLVPFDLGSTPPDTVGGRLRGKSGSEVIVTVLRAVPAAEDGVAEEPVELDLLLTPISNSAVRGLVYRATQRRRSALVDEWSGGRLGYTHIRGMNQPSLDEFERDIFAAAEGRDGLVVDVRDNGGGWTTDRLLASIMARPHAYTIPRGADQSSTGNYPQDRLYIQRYMLPMNMLCNEKSYSNAEIISHAFKTLGRGTLVGQRTHGSVISTGGTSLIDGTSVRLPFRGWYLQSGEDMENNGAVPDLIVVQTPEDEVAGIDAQLKAAVDDLLTRLDEPLP